MRRLAVAALLAVVALAGCGADDRDHATAETARRHAPSLQAVSDGEIVEAAREVCTALDEFGAYPTVLAAETKQQKALVVAAVTWECKDHYKEVKRYAD